MTELHNAWKREVKRDAEQLRLPRSADDAHSPVLYTEVATA